MQTDLNSIGRDIIGTAFEIRKKFGKHLLENFYEKVMAIELIDKGYNVNCQQPITIRYKNIEIENAYRIDSIINDNVIIEYKAKKQVTKEDFRQLSTYLKLSNKKLGYLINFGADDFCIDSSRLEDVECGIYRIVNNI